MGMTMEHGEHCRDRGTRGHWQTHRRRNQQAEHQQRSGDTGLNRRQRDTANASAAPSAITAMNTSAHSTPGRQPACAAHTPIATMAAR